MANSQYFGTLSALRYMQSQEGEADITGARALESAGESGRGLVEFFENMRSQEVFSEARRYPYFRSHPLSGQRIEALRRPVEAAAHYDQHDSPERLAEHALIVAKIRAFMDAPTLTLRTYPASNLILGGVTRDVVLELARELGLPVSETPFHIHHVRDLQECFLTGTTTDVMPVVQFDGAPVGSGKPGKMTMVLYEALAARLYGAAAAGSR